jgi:hypothetical protein
MKVKEKEKARGPISVDDKFEVCAAPFLDDGSERAEGAGGGHNPCSGAST